MSSRNNKFTKKTQKGGVFLGKGSFGCVVQPAIPCNKKQDKHLADKVSKIVKYPSTNIYNEIIIMDILKGLDKEGLYFVTYLNECVLTQIPKDRKDIKSVKFIDENLKEYYSLISHNQQKYKNSNSKDITSKNHTSKLDETSKQKLPEIIKKKTMKNKDTYCAVELLLGPLNIIMPYSGISLYNVRGKSPEMNEIFLKNFKKHLKHLLKGLLMMHDNFINHGDIKPSNILIDYLSIDKAGKKDKNKVIIKFIDFGSSHLLTESFTSKIENIKTSGTLMYLSPEYIASLFFKKILKQYNYDKQYIKENYEQIQKELHKYLVMKLVNFVNRFKISKTIFEDLDEYVVYITKELYNMHNRNDFLPNFFGTRQNRFDGIIQKRDVYALGLSMWDYLKISNDINLITHSKLYNLLTHMMDKDWKTRYNVKQCLNHPYFTT